MPFFLWDDCTKGSYLDLPLFFHSHRIFLTQQGLILYSIAIVFAEANIHLEIQYTNVGKHVNIVDSTCFRGYVQGYVQKRLGLLFKKHEKAWRRWVLVKVIEILRLTTKNRIEVNRVFFNRNTVPNKEQKYILDLIGVNV